MRILTSLIILLILSGLAGSQAQIIPFDNYQVREKAKRKKLPASYVYDVEQDRQGYLWFATQVGAIRYNGYSFTEYNIQKGLLDNNVSDILIDSKDQVWIATESGGVAILENGEMRLLNTSNGLVSDYAITLLEDRNGNIVYFSWEGISIIREDTIINYNESNSEINGVIYAWNLGLEDRVWFSTPGKLFCYDTSLTEIINPLFDKSVIHNILEDKPGSLWLATNNQGIIHLTPEGTHSYDAGNILRSNQSHILEVMGPDTVIVTTIRPGGVYRIIKGKLDRKWEKGLENLDINKIYIDSRKRIWLGSPEGLVLIENDDLKIINTDNNLVSNTIQKIFEDFNGNVWIATANGLSKYGKVVFEIYRNNFLNDNIEIFGIAERDNTVYLATVNGLNTLKGGIINEHYKKLSPSSLGLTSPFYLMTFDEKSNLWLASDDGIARFDGKSAKFISYKDRFPSDINELTTDLVWVNDTLYCGSTYGLLIYHNGDFDRLATSEGLSDDWIWSLGLDNSGNLWCGTRNGLSIFDGKSFHNYSIADGLPANSLNDITFDSKGSAWIATDNGISRVMLNQDWSIACENLNSKRGLTSNIVYSILIDKNGSIWGGLDEGLNRIDPLTLEITHYSSYEGFLPVETSQGAVTRGENGELWFGTPGGAVRYIPKNDIKSEDPPKIYIDSIKLFNDRTDIFQYAEGSDPQSKLPKNLSLPYNKNNLVFHYVGLHYTIIEKNRYKYMLEGYDSDWSESTDAIVTPPYRKLPPGNYTFKVMAANCDGVWTEKPAEFSFEIRPPFYKTWWFYSLEGITFLLLLFAFIRLRERKLRQDKVILTQKVKERTIEIEKQRDQIAYQKKEITDSILYAERIQSAVLPKHEYINSLLKEYFILFKPRDIVSGDFYWINGKDGRIIVVAADCTGHGVPGAFMSMLGVSILNELASSPEAMPSDSILNQLRDHLTKTLRQTGKDEDAKDGMDLAMCIIDTKKMEVQFSGAYNPLVHIRNGECEVYKGDKMPVGFHMGSMNPFSSTHIKVEEGDCLYMFSDGYADQFGGEEDKKFKTSKLRELLTNIYYLPMEEQKSRLDETIESWKGINEQVDDILVVGIRI
ncbi:MAG: SpoIIE family protein phosphatase [Bacteroidales bacterium]|nr:SpoIIE family protein phosphatase [Bacteroidales bacterium]